MEVDANGKVKIEAAIASWAEKQAAIEQQITAENLRKLRTAGKSLILAYAKCGKIEVFKDGEGKTLAVSGHLLDFS